MDIISIVNTLQPNTIKKLALKASDFPNNESSIPFMGVYVQLFDGAILPSEAEVTAYAVTYTNGLLTSKLLSALDTYRGAKEVAGITLHGLAISTDKVTQGVLTGARILAKENDAYSINWVITESSTVQLNAATIISIADAVATYVQKCFNSQATLINSINNYSDVATLLTAFDTLMAA